MESIDALKESLNNAGKLEKISIFKRILTLQIKSKDKEALKTYESVIRIFKEYLEFDKNPPEIISNEVLEIFKLIFEVCQFMGSSELFHKLLNDYNSLKNFFSNKKLLAEVYSSLNYLYWMDSAFDKAIKYGEKAIKLLEQGDFDDIIPGRYSNLGYIYECKSDYEKAEEFYDKGLQFGLKINSDKVLCLAYCGFGRLNLLTGNYSQAVNYFTEALAFFPEKNDDYISVVNNLGIALGRMGRNEEAIELFSSFLNEETKQKYSETYYDLLLNCANSYLAIKDFNKSELQLNEALSYAKSNNRNDLAIGVLVNLGNIEKKRKNWQKSKEYYEKSLEYNHEECDMLNYLLAKLGIGIIYFQNKDFSKSKKYLTESLQLAEQYNHVPETLIIHEYLFEIYEKEENYYQALQHLKKLKKLQIDEEVKKFEIDIKKMKQKFKYKEQNLAKNPCDSAFQLISKELSNKIKSPIIGVSNQMQKVVDHAKIAALNPDINVLISGESGTGKEIIAKLIHYASPRKKKPFIVVNTSAFTESLIESAFFGNEKGAFTGADKFKEGYFEAAKGGSIFLDEIGDMPLLMQVKFLRVIEQKVLHRVGSVQDVKLDFRLISASNKDLHSLSHTNDFRYDLLNRINTLEIHIPPLRKRSEDIPVLVHFFFDLFASQLNRKRPVIAKKALELLISYNYPGNVREMKNIIQRTLMFTDKDIIDQDDVMFSINNEINDAGDHIQSLNLKENEKMLIHKAMNQSNQVQLRAAKLLGISPYSLNRKLKKLNEGSKK